MHPVLARFLDVGNALETLGRAREDGVGLDASQMAFLDAVQTAPELGQALEAAQGHKHLSEATQNALLTLAAQTTLRMISQDAELQPLLAGASLALESAGATPDQSEAYLSALVLEEAFGGDEDVDDFDGPFFAETLGSIPALVGLTSERVQKLSSDWVRKATAQRLQKGDEAAQAILQAAWEDGPEPINVEHVSHALESMGGTSEAARALGAFLDFLTEEKLLGPRRRERLQGPLGPVVPTAQA